MAYKWENGKVVRVSMPKKLSPENEKALEEYWRNTKIDEYPFKDLFNKVKVEIVMNGKS